MAIRIEVRTQAEFDACVKVGNIAVVVSGRVEAWENSSVEAWGNSRVEAWGNSSVEAWGNSRVVAWGNSRVVAWENSSVEAWGFAFIRWFAALKIKASLTVIIAKMPNATGDIKGGNIVECIPPKTPTEWCEHYGVEVKDGIAILYKGLDDQFKSNHGTFYVPGTTPIAADWDGGKRECGGGLHYSPLAQMTKEFASTATKFVACPVALADMRAPQPTDDYPQKTKARGCCGPVYEVDKNGRRV